MTKKNDITLPTPEDERLLNDVLEDSVDYVEVRGKKYGISWLKRGTIRKFTSTMQKSGNDDKIPADLLFEPPKRGLLLSKPGQVQLYCPSTSLYLPRSS